MERIPKAKVRHIGVSNFDIKHLETLLNDANCHVTPAVNQVEVNIRLFYLLNREKDFLTTNSFIHTGHLESYLIIVTATVFTVRHTPVWGLLSRPYLPIQLS